MYTRRMLDPARIMERCDALARHSELPGGLTRVFLSPEARAASDQVLGWMREAGMQAQLDAIGNASGRYEGERPGLACLMLGSHLDTVRDATVVPSEAVQAGQQGTYVYVVKTDGTAEMRPVEAGHSYEGRIVIEQGVKPGETVVTDGHLRIFPGAKIQPVEAAKGQGAKQ